MSGPGGYEAIGAYGFISDCHSSALVSASGSIDWACLRRFDSGAAFCGLLDAAHGGRFEIRAESLRASRRSYVPDTLVLETVFETATGKARLLDCFAMRRGGRTRPYRQLLRVVEGLEGEVAFAVCIEPRFDFGTLPPWLRHHDEEDVYSAVGGDDALVLSSDSPLTIDAGEVRLGARLRVGAGERRRFSVIASMAHAMRPRRVSDATIDRRLEQTIAWWRTWVTRGHYTGSHRDAVVRSALVLKGLTCAPTGGIVAAPTCSLPEAIGGSRNWDYRYCWVRDATLALSALFSVGHPEVAQEFKTFIERTTAGRASDLQIMYGCYGERRLPELELPKLEGYRGSRPVRVGNAAASQRQLDVFGELLDAWDLWTHAGNPISDDEWRFLRGLVEAASTLWKEPDQGLWEMRGPPRHHVFSKVMCWVALDRGIALAERHSLPCDLERYRRVRDEIREAVETEGFDAERGCFVQAFGTKAMDASLLRLPLVGFVPADDPRMTATVSCIEDELAVGDLLLRRYRGADDGLEGEEGCFLLASLWLVQVLAMQGHVDEAERRLDGLLALGNELGLFAEEYLPGVGQLGNFPQAFTHLGIIAAVEHVADAKAQRRGGRAASGERASARAARRPR